jgi:hypothetical protein
LADHDAWDCAPTNRLFAGAHHGAALETFFSIGPPLSIPSRKIPRMKTNQSCGDGVK